MISVVRAAIDRAIAAGACTKDIRACLPALCHSTRLMPHVPKGHSVMAVVAVTGHYVWIPFTAWPSRHGFFEGAATPALPSKVAATVLAEEMKNPDLDMNRRAMTQAGFALTDFHIGLDAARTGAADILDRGKTPLVALLVARGQAVVTLVEAEALTTGRTWPADGAANS